MHFEKLLPVRELLHHDPSRVYPVRAHKCIGLTVCMLSKMAVQPDLISIRHNESVVGRLAQVVLEILVVHDLCNVGVRFFARRDH